MTEKTRKMWWMLGLVLLVAACSPPATDNGGPEVSEGSQVALSCGDGKTPDIHCPALPDTNATGEIIVSTVNNYAVLDYDIWAWNSFVALNWPAANPADAPNKRGLPDTTEHFATAANNVTTVWETFKEKREIFLYNQNTGSLNTGIPLKWNEGPQYGPADAPVPCCTVGGCDGGDVFERHLANHSGVFSDTLDETAEVASQARELSSDLCKGYTPTTNPTLAQCQALFPPATTEAELSTRHPVGPRVYFQGPDDLQPYPVLYEVKLNKDYFDYVFDNKFYDLETTRNYVKSTGPITLPARTGPQFMPPSPGSQTYPSTKAKEGPNPGSATAASYSAQTCLTKYQSDELCATGAIQVKAGWVNLAHAGDDVKKTYHTADVLHYRKNSAGEICKEPATYGLAGLHIIQRIHQTHREGGGEKSTQDGNKGLPRGGTFVFATWEHLGNDTAGLSYANFTQETGGIPVPRGPFPNVDTSNNSGGLPLTRLYEPLATTSSANTIVHEKIKAINPDSVWLNYRLIGTQYVAANPPQSDLPTQVRTLPATPQSGFEYPAGSGQPYYLANLVVESNIGLQQFQGLPPTGQGPIDQQIVQVIPHFRQSDTMTPGNVSSQFTGAYQREVQNLAYRTQTGGPSRDFGYNMGGCMGCHGVAQLSGYSFSFVLLDNQFGGKPDTLEDFDIPPNLVSPGTN